jgi:tetratricopeptide (TPR) repeat protein
VQRLGVRGIASFVLMLAITACAADRGQPEPSSARPTPALLADAQACIERGDLDAAHALLARAVELDPGSAEAWRWHDHVCVLIDDHEEALRHLARAIELEPLDPWTHYARGVSLKTLGRYDAAIASFTRALELDPRHAKALVHRGHAHLLAGHLELARADFERTLADAATEPADRAWTESMLLELARARE